MVLQELIFHSVYYWESLDGPDRTDFAQFLLWAGVVVLKELIFNSFYTWDGVVVLHRTNFLQGFYFGRVWFSWNN